MNTQRASNSRGMWTETELAEFLGVSVRTVQGWRQRGGGPRFTKIGASVRYPPAGVDEWLAAGERTSTSDPGPGGEQVALPPTWSPAPPAQAAE